MLGSRAIQTAIDDGRIDITPFNREQLGPNSYDLRLGDWICRQRPEYDYVNKIFELTDPIVGNDLWCSPEHVADGIIDLAPGELILAHTHEFVSCYENIVGEMASRSSLMRSGIAVCVDAGLGDVGYQGRWTMEIYNHTRAIIRLHVGDRVAQMKFHEVQGAGMSYSRKGHGGEYGGVTDESKWDPNDMIPRSRMR